MKNYKKYGLIILLASAFVFMTFAEFLHYHDKQNDESKCPFCISINSFQSDNPSVSNITLPVPNKSESFTLPECEFITETVNSTETGRAPPFSL